ncbi:MAG: Pyruvate kinase [Verrucomicrobia subdivision 3 bacterium]|nr:Pyruvate kinase [Limisphaerales bacterium]MCS1416281.1 Pyruvate kinase [Limisphaerales bacterium]
MTSLPPVTQKDRVDTKLGIELGGVYFALSFVRQGDDVYVIRRFLSGHGNDALIIAKIEDQSVIENLEEIIKAADGLLVARGDLGIEVPFERLPIIQRRAVNFCLTMGWPVIVAMHLLESMVSSPIPTRAEVTDVAKAVFERGTV